jgi:hypothetical protein
MSLQEYPNVIPFLSDITSDDSEYSSILSSEVVQLQLENNAVSYNLVSIVSPIQGMCDFKIEGEGDYVAVLRIGEFVIDVGHTSFERFRYSTPLPLCVVGSHGLNIQFLDKRGNFMDSSKFSCSATALKFNDTILKRINFRFPLLLPMDSHADLCYNKESGLVPTNFTLQDKKFFNAVVHSIV